MVSSDIIDIVIPVYNEGENILSVLNAFQNQVHSKIRVLVCYDHDEDNTLTAIKNKTYPFEVVPIKNKSKFAHGAVVTGLYFGDSPAAISYMADDDYNANIIDQMIAAYTNGADVVVGSPFYPRWNHARMSMAKSLSGKDCGVYFTLFWKITSS